MTCIVKNDMWWSLVNLPKENNVIGLKCVYNTIFNEDRSVQKHKARLVAKGYSPKPGVDFAKSFAHVAMKETICAVIAIAAQNELEVFQLDVKSAFLNVILEEEVYVEQPQGFVMKDTKDKIYRLHEALYALKQTLRVWNFIIDSYLQKNGFSRSSEEPSLYTQKLGSDFLLTLLYVDDLIYTSKSRSLLQKFKEATTNEFEMTYLGLMKYFLGFQVKQSK